MFMPIKKWLNINTLYIKLYVTVFLKRENKNKSFKIMNCGKTEFEIINIQNFPHPNAAGLQYAGIKCSAQVQ